MFENRVMAEVIIVKLMKAEIIRVMRKVKWGVMIVKLMRVEMILVMRKVNEYKGPEVSSRRNNKMMGV